MKGAMGEQTMAVSVAHLILMQDASCINLHTHYVVPFICQTRGPRLAVAVRCRGRFGIPFHRHEDHGDD